MTNTYTLQVEAKVLKNFKMGSPKPQNSHKPSKQRVFLGWGEIISAFTNVILFGFKSRV